MTITRERESDYPGRQAHRRGDPCFGERPHDRLRNLYRKYVGRGGMIFMPEANCLWIFSVFFDIVFPDNGYETFRYSCVVLAQSQRRLAETGVCGGKHDDQ